MKEKREEKGTRSHVRGEKFVCTLPAGSHRKYLRVWVWVPRPVLVTGFLFLTMMPFLRGRLSIPLGTWESFLPERSFFRRSLKPLKVARSSEVWDTFLAEPSFPRRSPKLLKVAFSTATSPLISLNSCSRFCRDCDIGGILRNDKKSSHKSPISIYANHQNKSTGSLFPPGKS